MVQRDIPALPGFAADAALKWLQAFLRDDTHPSLCPWLSRTPNTPPHNKACFPAAALLLVGLLGSGCGTPGNSIQPPPPGWPPPQIKNLVIIIQENRTPDNLFHYLSPACPLPMNPGSVLDACIPSPVTSSCYDVSPCGLWRHKTVEQVVPLAPRALNDRLDPAHEHENFNSMCDPDPVTLKCRNDGAGVISLPLGGSYSYVENSPVANSDGSQGHVLDPYLTLAENYGWANFMYQTNQGPSYPAHQFLFSGTSALSAQDDANSTFIAEGDITSVPAGCLASSGPSVYGLLSPVLSPPASTCSLYAGKSVEECPIANTALVYPTNPVGSFCVQHQSMADLLDPRSISWKYYASSAGSIWNAPDAFANICQPRFLSHGGSEPAQLQCQGSEWDEHVDVKNLGTDILRDVGSCSLSQVSWVIPDGRWSDHPPFSEWGPSWVAAIVNAIGNNPQCPQGTPDAGQTYWENTAIVITWDDWGGWSDNQPPPYLSDLPCTSLDCQGDYQLGFRVPMIVVSAYTPPGYIDNVPHDFGTILRTIEGINGIPEGALGFADERATTDLRTYFPLIHPRPFQTIPAQVGPSFFLTRTGQPTAPDVD